MTTSTDPSTIDNALQIAERFSMHGRKALVSIGREIALAFAQAGSDVAVHFARAADIAFGQPSAADETVAASAARGRRSVAIEADFAKPGGPTRCVEAARQALHGLDVRVVCASVQ